MSEDFSLSPQQAQAFENVMAWHQTTDKRYILAGYAGAGKTTIAKVIAEAIGIDDVIFCAYTGKAANVLREKGARNSSTIHGAIYTLINDEDLKPRFILNQDSEIKLAKLVIVDEYSMLPEEIINDIEKLAKKVLYLGDPFQLPPVKGECTLRPDFFLEEIHRQALESPIIRYATDVRSGRQLSFVDHPEFVYAPRAKFHPTPTIRPTRSSWAITKPARRGTPVSVRSSGSTARFTLLKATSLSAPAITTSWACSTA